MGEEEKEKNNIKLYIAISLSIVFIWIVFMFIMFWSANDFSFKVPPSTPLEYLGIFGDSFNILTSLFTGLAFAGVIISVILQTKELEATRHELKGQKNAIEKQNFENTFFNMITLHNNIVNDVEYIERNLIGIRNGSVDSRNTIYKGRKAITKINHVFMQNTNNNKIEAFNNIYEEYSTQLGLYFRNIYHILKLIENGKIDNKKFYSNVLRAQLSTDELILLYFNGLTNGIEKAKPLFEKYEFFEPLDLSWSILNEDIINMYEDSAYGENSE